MSANLTNIPLKGGIEIKSTENFKEEYFGMELWDQQFRGRYATFYSDPIAITDKNAEAHQNTSDITLITTLTTPECEIAQTTTIISSMSIRLIEPYDTVKTIKTVKFNMVESNMVR